MFKSVFSVFFLVSIIFSASVMANDPSDERNISDFTSRDGFYLEATRNGIILNQEYEFEFADEIKGRCWFEASPSLDSHTPIPLKDKLIIGWEGENGMLREESPVIIVHYGNEIGAMTLHFRSNPLHVNTLECRFEGWGKGPDQITVGRLRSYFDMNIWVQRLQGK